jgi:hypothetical protein
VCGFLICLKSNITCRRSETPKICYVSYPCNIPFKTHYIRTENLKLVMILQLFFWNCKKQKGHKVLKKNQHFPSWRYGESQNSKTFIIPPLPASRLCKERLRHFTFEITILYVLGEFAKLRQATISFVMPDSLSVRPSVRPHETRLPLGEFSLNFISEYFRKSVEEIQVSLQSNEPKGYFTWRPRHFFISRSFLLLMINVSDKSCGENQNAHFVFSNGFSKIVPFMR